MQNNIKLYFRGAGGRNVFPITSECQSVDGLQGQHVGTITTRTGNSGTVGTYIVEGEQFSQGIKQIGNLIDTDSFGGNPQLKENGEPMFTLTAQDRHGVSNGFRIRKLTPKECWRLQGFPDWAFDWAREAGVSDSQLYKQAGNSVTVNVIEAIGKKFYMEEKDGEDDKQ